MIASIDNIFIFIHKLQCGLKCVHSLLCKQEALAITDQSFSNDFLKKFSLIRSRCASSEYLLTVYTKLAVPKIAPIKRKTSKIRDI